MRRQNALDEIMSEPIKMPGFPQIIVTRGWLWKWLIGMGCNPRERGYGSVEWAVMDKPPVDAALTPETERDYFLLPLADEYAAGYKSYSEKKREFGLAEMEAL